MSTDGTAALVAAGIPVTPGDEPSPDQLRQARESRQADAIRALVEDGTLRPHPDEGTRALREAYGVEPGKDVRPLRSSSGWFTGRTA